MRETSLVSELEFLLVLKKRPGRPIKYLAGRTSLPIPELMAYEDYDDDSTATVELLDTATKAVNDLEERVRKLIDENQKSMANLRAEIQQSRKEVAESRAQMMRMSAKLDNQLVALILANIASGVGVAALILGASRAF